MIGFRRKRSADFLQENIKNLTSYDVYGQPLKVAVLFYILLLTKKQVYSFHDI